MLIYLYFWNTVWLLKQLNIPLWYTEWFEHSFSAWNSSEADFAYEGKLIFTVDRVCFPYILITAASLLI